MSLRRDLGIKSISCNVSSLDTSAKTVFRAHVHPEKTSSLALIKLLDGGRGADNSQFISTLNKELSGGENPDQRKKIEGINGSNHSTSPLILAILYHGVEVLRALLNYGARPNARMFELAIQFHYVEKINLMISAFTHLTRSLSATPQKLVVEDTKFYLENNTVITHFLCKTNSKITHLKKTTDLTLKEMKAAFELFNQEFHSEHPLKIFLEEIMGDNKHIDLIYNVRTKKLEAFNLFELLPADTSANSVTCHWMYSVFDSSERGCGLMPLLAFRVPLSLQLLNPQYKTIIFLGVASEAGYGFVKDFLHFPKYKNRHMSAMMKGTLQKVFPDDSKIHFTESSCYVEESVRVRGSVTQSSLLRQFFREELLDMKHEQSDQNRVAQILLYVSDELWQKLNATTATLGINLETHIREFSRLFRRLLPENNNAPSHYRFAKSGPLFWLQEFSSANDAVISANDELINELRSRI